jgi:effector-binding domain-containing protein
MMGWIAEQGYEIAGPSQEVYLSDPNSVAPEQYVTEIRFPIKPR